MTDHHGTVEQYPTITLKVYGFNSYSMRSKLFLNYPQLHGLVRQSMQYIEIEQEAEDDLYTIFSQPSPVTISLCLHDYRRKCEVFPLLNVKFPSLPCRMQDTA